MENQDKQDLLKRFEDKLDDIEKGVTEIGEDKIENKDIESMFLYLVETIEEISREKNFDELLNLSRDNVRRFTARRKGITLFDAFYVNVSELNSSLKGEKIIVNTWKKSGSSNIWTFSHVDEDKFKIDSTPRRQFEDIKIGQEVDRDKLMDIVLTEFVEFIVYTKMAKKEEELQNRNEQ